MGRTRPRFKDDGMSQRLTSPFGHQWERTPDEQGLADTEQGCPVCARRQQGPPSTTPPESAGEAHPTLSDPPSPRADSLRRWPHIPDYEILEEIGKGGMGVVYKARQIKLNRIVAVKMVRGAAHADQETLIRFLHEAELEGRLQHPHFVQVHEVGSHDGCPFFSMEFVEGGNLARRLKQAPVPPRQAARWLQTLARAMHHAHQQGIVHRDLKPANILLTGDGVLKVTDFGLAKHVAVEGGLTQSGAVMGTPAYMAPEQAGGKTRQVGPAADVYSLGAILYEMLTGRPPLRPKGTWTCWPTCSAGTRRPRRACAAGCRETWRRSACAAWRRTPRGATPARRNWPRTCTAT
jgi:serine/threonine protein kinase